MADFTIRLCDLVSGGYDIEKEAMSEYPAENEEARKELNKFILRHYWLREIGFESPEIFSFFLNAALCEIMPYYNERRRINAFMNNIDPSKTFEELFEITRSGTNTETRTGNSSEDYTNTVESNSNRTGTDTTSGNGKTTSKDNSSNNADEYTKQYDIPTTGGSSGTGPGGFSNDFASSGSSGESNNTTTASGESTSENSSNTKSNSSETRNDTSTNKGTKESNDTVNGETSGTERSTRSGHNEAVYENVVKYREAVENLNMQIVNDKAISSLFMGMYDGMCDGYGCGIFC